MNRYGNTNSMSPPRGNDSRSKEEVVMLSMDKPEGSGTVKPNMVMDPNTRTWKTSWTTGKNSPIGSANMEDSQFYSSENPNLTHAYTISLKMGENGFDSQHLPNPIQERISREEYQMKLNRINELWKSYSQEGSETQQANRKVGKWAINVLTSTLCLLATITLFIVTFTLYWVFIGLAGERFSMILPLIFGTVWIVSCFGIILSTILTLFCYTILKRWKNTAKDERMRDKIELVAHYLDRQNEASLFNHGIAWRIKMPPSSQTAHPGWSRFARPGLDILVFESNTSQESHGPSTKSAQTQSAH